MVVDSETYVTATGDGMMNEKQFHCAVRGLTLAYETLVCILVSDFLQWFDEEGPIDSTY